MAVATGLRRDELPFGQVEDHLGVVQQVADRSVGSACLAEKRMLETIEQGAPKTPFLKSGDRVRIDMQDAAGRSIFGAIDQHVRV